jgi:hypothetical protein
MQWIFGAALLAAIPVSESRDVVETPHHVSYTTGYQAARAAQRPILLVLNPKAGSPDGAVTLEALCKTRQRRELLKNYVVVIVDTGTQHGQLVRESFGARQLPYVAVIDKRQQKLIYRTSDALQGQQWTWVLETYRTGEQAANASFVDPRLCTT